MPTFHLGQETRSMKRCTILSIEIFLSNVPRLKLLQFGQSSDQSISVRVCVCVGGGGGRVGG